LRVKTAKPGGVTEKNVGLRGRSTGGKGEIQKFVVGGKNLGKTSRTQSRPWKGKGGTRTQIKKNKVVPLGEKTSSPRKKRTIARAEARTPLPLCNTTVQKAGSPKGVGL